MDNIKLNKYRLTLSHLRFKRTLFLSINRLCSVNHYYVLRKSLARLGEGRSRIPTTLHKVGIEDVREMVASLETLDDESRQEMIARLLFYQAGFRNCYVARTGSNEMAFLQWLVFPSENDVIERYFSRKFYPLEQGQVMIENAFTFPKFRGLGLLPVESRKVLTLAKEKGFVSAITYIRKDKIVPLNEFMRMDFRITRLLREVRFAGITRRNL